MQVMVPLRWLTAFLNHSAGTLQRSFTLRSYYEICLTRRLGDWVVSFFSVPCLPHFSPIPFVTLTARTANLRIPCVVGCLAHMGQRLVQQNVRSSLKIVRADIGLLLSGNRPCALGPKKKRTRTWSYMVTTSSLLGTSWRHRSNRVEQMRAPQECWIDLERTPRHAELAVAELGVQAARPQTTPVGAKPHAPLDL